MPTATESHPVETIIRRHIETWWKAGKFNHAHSPADADALVAEALEAIPVIPRFNPHPFDLSTAQGRAAAFNARIDALMRPVSAGGKGLRFDAAIAEMRANAEDAALLRVMEGK